MLIAILLTTCVLCAIAFKYYGNFLNKRCRIDDDTPTPAHTNEDGVDFVPTRAAVVFGHHFSSIAGTGPIVGPVFAGIYFGWGPAWLWIILGCIFVGGVHDFGSTLLSLRNSGRSIAEVSTRLIGPWTGRLFMIFVLAALIYVLVVFLDLTAENFMAKPAVATASGWFILSALIFGFISTRTKIPFGISLLIFVPLTFLGLWFGHVFPRPGSTKINLDCSAAVLLPDCRGDAGKYSAPTSRFPQRIFPLCHSIEWYWRSGFWRSRYRGRIL